MSGQVEQTNEKKMGLDICNFLEKHFTNANQ